MSTVAYPIGEVNEGCCHWCGEVTPVATRRPRKWCSDLCSSRAAEFRRRGSAPEGAVREVPTNCVGCGAPIEQGERSRNPKKWCSQSCRVKTHRDNDPIYRYKLRDRSAAAVRAKNAAMPDRECEYCGKITPRTDAGRPKKYCSKRCGKSAAYRRGLLTAPECSEVGCSHPEISRGLCGAHYAAIWSKANADKRTASEMRYRAQKRHEGAESFTRIEVMELSNWTCHICGGKIERDCEYPNTLYGTVDHVVPLSKGGTHTLDNVKAAHHVCNSTKRDKEDYVHVG